MPPAKKKRRVTDPTPKKVGPEITVYEWSYELAHPVSFFEMVQDLHEDDCYTFPGQVLTAGQLMPIFCRFRNSPQNGVFMALKCDQVVFGQFTIQFEWGKSQSYTFSSKAGRDLSYVTRGWPVKTILKRLAKEGYTLNDEQPLRIQFTFTHKQLFSHHYQSFDQTSVLLSDLKRLYQTRTQSDCVIHLANDTREYVHTLILGARSPVFETMFAAPCVEKESHEVDWRTWTPAVARIALLTMYGHDVPVKSEQWGELLQLYHQYQMTGLFQNELNTVRKHVKAAALEPTGVLKLLQAMRRLKTTDPTRKTQKPLQDFITELETSLSQHIQNPQLDKMFRKACYDTLFGDVVSSSSSPSTEEALPLD